MLLVLGWEVGTAEEGPCPGGADTSGPEGCVWFQTGYVGWRKQSSCRASVEADELVVHVARVSMCRSIMMSVLDTLNFRAQRVAEGMCFMGRTSIAKTELGQRK